MPTKFVPRQRKHKVLQRQKAEAEHIEPSGDSNPVEHVPATKVQLQEKRQRIKDELRQNGAKTSGKKAKRLEKYIETKLRKDENRELISRLAKTKSDTSLYHSSSRLGQGRETKRQRLERALKDQQAGIDLDGDNDLILYDKRARSPVEAGEASDDYKSQDISLAAPVLLDSRSSGVGIGSGLKRPLDVGEDGIPILKKRKRRGGVKSNSGYKIPIPHKEEKFGEDSEWEGFSSTSEISNDAESHVSEAETLDDTLDTPNFTSKEIKGLESSHEFSQDGDEDDEEESSDNSEDSQERIKPRSSAFKAWANQQINEALGYQPISNIQTATESSKTSGFKARIADQDPLPLELQPTANTLRKAYSITVNRTPEIQDIRLQLPVVAEEQKIMEAIHNNNVVFICGSTGSGKTTQIPQFLFEAGYGSPDSPTPGMIGITQPRRVAAVSMAQRVGDEMCEYRKKVAYQIRFEGTVSSETAIKFMTDGVMLREVSQDISMKKYSAIIIDEAHERSLNTDILIGMLSRVVKLRQEMAEEDSSIKPLKLVVMSATLRINDFIGNTSLFSSPPPVVEAEGRQYSVTNHFTRKTHHDYVQEAFQKISKGHKKLPPGGFLVFLTGQSEIAHLSALLKEKLCADQTNSNPHVKISGRDAPIETEDLDLGLVTSDEDEDDVDINLADEDFEIEEDGEAGPAKMYILPLYSLLPTKEQMRVFKPPPDGSRLIVLATNVAETSLTIPGIRYVFDSGRSKERKYCRDTGVQSFEIGWISKASAKQRAGRAGRTGPGHCYRLYSSAVYERDFQEFSEPEILRMPIEGVVLQLKSMNLQHVVNFPFPTSPGQQTLADSEKLLSYLAATSASGQITPIGSTMSIFPLPPRLTRILLLGHQHNCLPYIIALVAGLSVPNIFIPENQIVPPVKNYEEDFRTNSMQIEEDHRLNIKTNFNKVHKNFCFLDDKSDAIKLLQAVGEFAHEPTESWCRKNYVNFKSLKEVTQLQKQITELLRINISTLSTLKYQEKLQPPTVKQIKVLKQMVAAGYIDHVAARADLAPNPPDSQRKPKRAIDVPYLTLFPSSVNRKETEEAVYIHPSSPLSHLSPQECPEYLIYSYLQRAPPNPNFPEKHSKTRLHALTDITGNQLAALAKGTTLIHYGKPLKAVMPKVLGDGSIAEVRECWVIPYLRPESNGGMGWPLPARKVRQRKLPGQGWVVE
ncbi:unnamed protein product [Blumeria hordei]|uniref:RNA helicase n=1 Tax=Blumeria hordei TaxID=2867405 RepID=A0A383UPL2_BLUHO|nr:unnamed protein product [Blumeria hordei]